MAKERFKKTYRGIAYMLLGCALMYVLFNNAMSVLSRQEEITKLEAQMRQVEKEKAELENEVELLGNDDYVTRYARENYVFTRDGEQVAILPENNDAD